MDANHVAARQTTVAIRRDEILRVSFATVVLTMVEEEG